MGGRSVSVSGLAGVIRNLKAAPKDIIRPSVRSAGKKAMQIVKKDVIRRALAIDNPETPTVIAKNIGMRSRFNSRQGIMRVSVGVLGGDGSRSSARYSRGDKERLLVTYWRYVELGTSRSAARPFLRPALENNAESVLSEFVAQINQQLEKRQPSGSDD